MFTTTPTRAEFRARLADRLDDTANVHWTSNELNLIIAESIRTWNSGAFYHRARGSINTVIGQPFYDLESLLDDGSGNKILGMAATDQDVCQALQYRLMEPITSDFTLPWAGTEQFTYSDISSAIEKRRDQFLLATGQIVSIPSLVPVTSGNGRIALSDSFIDVRRVAWKTPENTFTNLWLVDEYTLNRRLVGWNRNSGTPQSYSLVTSPETHLQLAPVPNDTGNLHLLVVQSGAAIDFVASPILGVFEDFVAYVQWGALAELLSRDGPAKDELRSAYCEQRFKEGIELAKIMATSLQVLVDDEDVPVQSLDRLDIARPNWQHTSASAGVSGVELVAQAGPNLIAMYKVPSISYTFTVDVVRNAIVPTKDDDHIQVGDEYSGILLGYAQHLALFKDGGLEFDQTMSLYKAFFTAMVEYNGELKQNADNFDILKSRGQIERTERDLAPIVPRAQPQQQNG